MSDREDKWLDSGDLLLCLQGVSAGLVASGVLSAYVLEEVGHITSVVFRRVLARARSKGGEARRIITATPVLNR